MITWNPAAGPHAQCVPAARQAPSFPGFSLPLRSYRSRDSSEEVSAWQGDLGRAGCRLERPASRQFSACDAETEENQVAAAISAPRATSDEKSPRRNAAGPVLHV